MSGGSVTTTESNHEITDGGSEIDENELTSTTDHDVSSTSGYFYSTPDTTEPVHFTYPIYEPSSSSEEPQVSYLPPSSTQTPSISTYLPPTSHSSSKSEYLPPSTERIDYVYLPSNSAISSHLTLA